MRAPAYRRTASISPATASPQQVDDLEAARNALGYDRIDLLSESAGTRTAMIYSWRYPKSIHRSVMIGVNPPGHFLWDAKATDEQIGRYAALCAKDDAAASAPTTSPRRCRRASADIPDRWLFLPIKRGQRARRLLLRAHGVDLGGGAALRPDDARAPGSPPLRATRAGSGSSRSSPTSRFPKSFVWGEMAAAREARRASGERLLRLRRLTEPIRTSATPATAFIWGGGRLADAWPAAPDESEYSRVRTSNVETLLIGGALDFATPPQIATKELLPYLPNGHQVVLPGFGHTTTFWTEQPEAGSRLINTFLDSGEVDDSLYKPESVDFTPEVTQTALAKGIAGAMVGLALLTVLSLLWMARRVHKRGRFGRKASATLRSLYPIVLGLGGWFLGVLIVVTTMPGVPLDNELLAAALGRRADRAGHLLRLGEPRLVGQDQDHGIRGGDGRRPRRCAGWGSTRRPGSWRSSPRSLGAAVGANLPLIVLDIGWDRQARDRFAASTVKETLEAQRAGG